MLCNSYEWSYFPRKRHTQQIKRKLRFVFFDAILIDDTNMLNVPEIFVIIESMPYDESIRNLEPDIIRHKPVTQLRPLPQETRHPNGLGLGLLLQQAQQPPNGPARIHDILHDEDVLTLQSGQRIQAHDLDPGLGVRGRVLVALQADEVHRNLHTVACTVCVEHVELLLQVGVELVTAFEHHQDVDGFAATPLDVGEDVIGKLLNAVLDQPIRDQDRVDRVLKYTVDSAYSGHLGTGLK